MPPIGEQHVIKQNVEMMKETLCLFRTFLLDIQNTATLNFSSVKFVRGIEGPDQTINTKSTRHCVQTDITDSKMCLSLVPFLP